MADETPEQIREKVLAEELGKGSDPRVAEARSKAAEMRARHGLPIEPQQAWRAKLEQEGGAPAQAAAVAEEPDAVAEEVPSEVKAVTEAPAEEAAVSETVEEPAAPESAPPTPSPSVDAPVPSGVEVQRESADIVAVAVSPPAV